MKKQFVLDGTRFSNIDEFYAEVQSVLTNNLIGFGRNLDAFNDVLYGGFGKFEPGENIDLIWINSDKSKKDLGYPETVRYMKYALPKIHPLNLNRTHEIIKGLEQGIGATLFNMLIGPIENNKNIELTLK